MRSPRSLLLLVAALLAAVVGFLFLIGPDERGSDLQNGSEQSAEREAASLEAPAGVDADSTQSSTQEQRSVIAAEPQDVGACLVGRVVDRAGAPIAGARVVCRSNTAFRMQFEADSSFDPFDPASWEQMRRRTDANTREAVTERDGTFRVAAPSSGGELRLRVLARQYLVLDRSAPRPAETDVDLGALALESGAVVSGRVLDRSGQPIAGAVVSRASARERGGFAAFGNFDQALFDADGGESDRSDAEGKFELPHVPPGAFRLRARHDEHPTGELENLEVAAGGMLADLVIALDPGTTIRGKLLDVPRGTTRLRVLAAAPRGEARQNEGVQFIFAGAEEVFGTGPTERSADVGEDGTFTLRGLAMGKTYQVWAAQRGRGFPGASTCSARKDVLAGAQDVELRFEAGVTVTFTAVDAGTGAPIEKLWLSHRLVGNNNTGFDPAAFVSMPARPTDCPRGLVTLPNLRPKAKQTLTFSVEGLGFAMEQRQGIELPLVGTLDLGTIRLEATPLVQVEVRGRDGQPVAGATVRVREAKEDGPPLAGPFAAMVGGGGPRTATTDAAGRATLSGTARARTTIAVAHDEFAPYTSEELTVSERGLEHAVTLLRGGAVDVLVVDAEGRPVGEVSVEQRGPADTRDTKRTTTDGKVRFEHLTPGTHSFALAGRGNHLQMGDNFVVSIPGLDGAPRQDDGGKQVEVVDEGSATIQLEKATLASVSGIVTQNGVPLAGAQVTFLKGTGEATGETRTQLEGLGAAFAELSARGGGGPGTSRRTDDSGRFELKELPAGEHRLRVSHRDRAMPTVVRVSLRTGSNVNDVDLAATILRGVVRTQAGEPIEGATVTVAAAGSGDEGAGQAIRISLPGGSEPFSFGGRRAQTKTDAQGRYELNGVQDGVPVVVNASASGYVRGRSGPVTAIRGSARDGVDVQLDAAGSVRVSSSAETPFARVEATCVSTEGVAPVSGLLSRGSAKLDGLRPGTWRIALHLPGTETPQTRTVDVAEGKETTVRF